jgi:hypothetical protein
VVISIIAVLAALMLPVIGEARESARKALCLPDVSSQDGSPYEMHRSNHAAGNLPNGGAAGSNALLKDGSARWMNLSAIWGDAARMERNLYDYSGYGEGTYAEYVADDMAALFQ